MSEMNQEEMAAKIAELSDALSHANSEAASRRKAEKELKERLAGYDGLDPEQYRKDQERLKKLDEEKMKAAGQFDELKSRMQQEHETALKQWQEKYGILESRYKNAMIDERLATAFAKSNAVSVEDAVALTRSNFDIDENGVFVKASDGSTMMKDGQRVSIEQFAEDWLSARPYLVKGSGGGSGAQGGKGASDIKTISRKAFEALPHKDRAEFFKNGGKVAG